MTTDRLLTPSKITAWLDCGHYLTLQYQVSTGTLAAPHQPFGSFAQLLADKGLAHEQDCLEQYRAQGMSVFEVPARERGESFAAWVDRVGNPLTDGHDVIYQMPLIHDGVRGIADFLIRVDDPATGESRYEPVDAKLARAQAKPGHVLQLCFYADALESLTGHAPEQIHLWLGSGHFEHLDTEDVRPYWNRLRSQLRNLVAADPGATATEPEPCAHCEFCEFADHCEAQWRSDDSLIYVAGIRQGDRDTLELGGVDTLALLAQAIPPVDGLQPERLARLAGQATLQVSARGADEGAPPPFRLVPPSADPTWGRGFELLPQPDDADVFLDFEGHPFWRADTGLFFLFGYISRNTAGAWEYTAHWAHDRAEEAVATREVIEYFVDRRAEHPGMHVYHYNHTERSALQSLSAEHGVAESALALLVETGAFVDLFTVVRNAVQVGAESYGLKHMELLAGFVRGDDIHQGAGAVVEYEAFMNSGEQTNLNRIAAYNEDDVRATRALRDWLIAQRPGDLEWRSSYLEPEDMPEELDEQVAALHAFDPDSPEHQLGDVLGYWLREWRAHKATTMAKLNGDQPSLIEHPEVIAGLVPIGRVEPVGKQKQPGMTFLCDSQTLHDDVLSGRANKVMFGAGDGQSVTAGIRSLDVDSREMTLTWGERAQELGVLPTEVVLDDWVPPKPKPEALSALASQVIDPEGAGAPSRVAIALLRRDLPAFTAGHGPTDGSFTDDLDEMVEWVSHLDHTCVAIQGPPGTGKTFRGAHIVHSLIMDGQRVGITAMSHHAIDNLMEAVVELFREKGNLTSLRAARRGNEPRSGGLDGVTYLAGNPKCANGDFNLVAGTTWLFAGKDMRAAPVEVLIVDEAGQLALADALATTGAATNLVLLGDPLQLSQVSQASHPGGGGLSVLEHVLGEHTTMPPDRGVFLSETRRMHPDVCEFISERIYEGRLASHPSCALQTTEFGTGLRWLSASHEDCSTESVEEAEIVADEILRLLGTEWTNQHGTVCPLGVDDFMVVAPYNNQVRLIRDRLDADPRTRGVPVGTVDKFQGRQAAVVFFTMTASSASDIPRGADFLFSRNRLNVAVSRARCLAYLVCTEQLLDSRARDVDEMRLIATLCSFVEYAE